MTGRIHPMADLPPDLLTPIGANDDDTQLLTDALDQPGAIGTGDDDGEDYDEQPDGSVIVRPKNKPEKKKGRFDDNLAEKTLSHEELMHLGMTLTELVDADKEARKDRDKQYAEGIKRTGLAQQKGVGADFDGASSVTHPMLAKGCIDFASKAIKETFPASGPVRTQIIGEQTEIKVERAERKKQFMNWQLTTQIPEHRPETEKMLSQLPLGGSQYKRWWWDAKLERPRTAAVYIDDIFLPFDQNDFYTSPRLTHREFLGRSAFEARVASKLYIDPTGSRDGENPDRSEAAKASREVEGVDDDDAYMATGGTREVYTIYADLELDDDSLTKGDLAPYIIHISEYQNKVLAVYRNWDENDEKRQKLDWIVEYDFIPWRGAYGIGLAHVIGSMAVASTGTINALLDSAHIQNFPGGIKLKGGRTSGQTVSVNPTELQEIDAPPGVDDIRKVAMPFPFNGPSAVLYQLLEWLTQQAEIVVATASEKIAEGGADMPMGTALALIEGGSTNFSAIHARLHHSCRKELQILHRLNKTYLNDKETVEDLGELVVYREDFQGPMDIIPVSDPNIFSEAQRYAQFQALLQLKADPAFANFFKPERLLLRAIKLLQIDYGEDIANLPVDPKRLPPCDENAEAATDQGAPLKVYKEQDDLAHLESHVVFMTSPLYGGSPLIGSIALPKLMQHCKEHMVAYYKKNHEAAAYALKTVAKMQGQELTDEQAQAKGHAFADQIMAQNLSPMIAPALQKAQEMMMNIIPKPQPDGNTAATLAAEQQVKGQELQLRSQDLEKDRKFKAQAQQNEQAFKAQEAQLDRQAQDARAAADRDANRQASQLATMLENMQIQSDERIAQFAEHMASERTNLAEKNKIFLAEMNSQTQALLVVLKEMMAQMSAQPGVEQYITPLLDGMNTNSQALMQQFAEHGTVLQQGLGQLAGGMQQLHNTMAAPRTVKHIRDGNGDSIGVETSIEGQEPVRHMIAQNPGTMQ